MTEPEIPAELRLIAPSIGTRWVWEPMKAHAVAVVTVTNVKWNGEAVYVEAEGTDGQRFWNELDRWVEATVLIDTPDDPESGHDFIRTVPTDGKWCRLCGVSEARWDGDACPMHGGAEHIERLLIDERTKPR